MLYHQTLTIRYFIVATSVLMLDKVFDDGQEKRKMTEFIRTVNNYTTTNQLFQNLRQQIFYQRLEKYTIFKPFNWKNCLLVEFPIISLAHLPR